MWSIAARDVLCDDEIVDELDDDVLRRAPIDLVANFRDALLAILPAADTAQLSWHDDNQHYEWERLAMTMFDVFVRQPVSVDQHRWPDEKPLAQYDIDRPDYAGCSWLELGASPSDRLAFVRFLSDQDPFDTVEVCEVSAKGFESGRRRRIPWPPNRLDLVRHGANARIEIVTQIDAVE